MRTSIALIALLLLSACAAPQGGSAGIEVADPLKLARSGIIQGDAGVNGLVSFGSQRGVAEAAARAGIGPALSWETATACPSGPMEFTAYPGLTLSFMDGEFVGWTAETPGGPETSQGIGVGSQEAALSAAYDTQLEITALGRQFNAEGFNGVITAGEITTMWAGASCFTG